MPIRQKTFKHVHYDNHKLHRNVVYPDPFILTLITDGHGSLVSDITSGFNDDVAHLTATPSAQYRFTNYQTTGASVTGNDIQLTADTTAKANFYLTSYNPSGEDAWYYVHNDQPICYEETAVHDFTITASNCDYGLLIAGGTHLTAWGVPSPKRYVVMNSTIYMPRANSNNWFEFRVVDDSYNPTGSNIPFTQVYKHSMTGTHAVSVISDSTNNRTSAFVDRELVSTANTNVGNAWIFVQGDIDFGVTGRISHFDARSFSTYADAYNTTQVINN